MQVTNILTPITKGVKNKCIEVSRNASERVEIASRAARIKNKNGIETSIAKSRAYISGGCKPVVDGMIDASDSMQIVSNASKAIKKKIRATKKKNPMQSQFATTIQGLKESVPEITDAIKELGGIKDIKAATEAGGKMQGAKEAAKATFRLGLSGSLYILGNFIPIPATSIAGLMAGEKVADLLVGKRFTKQIEKIAQLKKN